MKNCVYNSYYLKTVWQEAEKMCPCNCRLVFNVGVVVVVVVVVVVSHFNGKKTS